VTPSPFARKLRYRSQAMLAALPVRILRDTVSGIFWAIFGIVFSTLVLPLPEEVALLYAGWTAHSGSISLPGAFIASFSAVMIGDTLSYFVGRAFLPRLLASRFGRRLVSPALRRWAEDLVQRHGFRTVLLGRFLVALRGPVYLAVGAARYPALRFLVLNGLVGLVEVSIVVYAGYLFGLSHELAHELRWIEGGIGVLIAATLIVPFLFKRHLERKHAVA
jgi:membrane protein DedA with SNARE-associated domain